jgi:hypothetical protein
MLYRAYEWLIISAVAALEIMVAMAILGCVLAYGEWLINSFFPH